MKTKKLILIFQHLTLAVSLLIAGAVIFLSIAAHAGGGTNDTVSRAKEAWLAGDRDSVKEILWNGVLDYRFRDKLSEENIDFLFTLINGDHQDIDREAVLDFFKWYLRNRYVGDGDFFYETSESDLEVKHLLRRTLDVIPAGDEKIGKDLHYSIGFFINSAVNITLIPRADLNSDEIIMMNSIAQWQPYLNAFSDKETLLLFGLNTHEINEFSDNFKKFYGQKDWQGMMSYARPVMEKAEEQKEKSRTEARQHKTGIEVPDEEKENEEKKPKFFYLKKTTLWIKFIGTNTT